MKFKNTADDPDLEARLQQLAAAVVEGHSSVEDASLIAYRRGELEPAESEVVEMQLAASWRARERLAQLAGAASEMPPELPDRIRAALGTRRPHRAWRAAAAAAATAVVGGWLTLDLAARAPSNEPLPGYQVRVVGAASQRDAPAMRLARRSTRLRVIVRPLVAGEPNLSFAIYHRRDAGWRRVAGQGVELVVERGTAVFTGLAERFVGDRAGTHQLAVVISRRDQPPIAASLAPEGLAALAGDARYQVELVDVELQTGVDQERSPKP